MLMYCILILLLFSRDHSQTWNSWNYGSCLTYFEKRCLIWILFLFRNVRCRPFFLCESRYVNRLKMGKGDEMAIFWAINDPPGLQGLMVKG